MQTNSSHRVAAGAAALMCSLAGSDVAQAKNYLVIIADDLGVDKVSSYSADYSGYSPSHLPQTDTIDSIGAAGLRFTRAWSNPVCSPTRATLNSGVHAFRSGIGGPLDGSDAGLDTTAFTMLAGSFQTFGFDTALFGKWHVGTLDAAGATGGPASSPYYDAPHPSLAGYDLFDGKLEGDIDDYWSWSRVGWYPVPALGLKGTETTHATDFTAQAAANWIGNRTGDWFAVVSFHAPHSATIGSPWSYEDTDPTQYRTSALSCLQAQSCADEVRASYQGLVEHMDLQIEWLLNDIDPEVLDDTIIIFIGDNGTPSEVQESTFDDGRGKGTSYENGIRVPMVVADGGTWRTGASGDISAPGRAVSLDAHVMDIYQTLYNDAFLISAASVDSRSFIDCFTDSRPHCGIGRRLGYTETFQHGPGGALTSAKIAVRFGDEKMVAQYNRGLGCMDESFYDTASDPLETATTGYPLWKQNRLRNYFTGLHSSASDWGYGLTFCP